MVGLGGKAACAGSGSSCPAAPAAPRSASTEAPKRGEAEPFAASRAGRTLSASSAADGSASVPPMRPASKGCLDVVVPIATFASAPQPQPPPGLRTRLQRKLSFNRATALKTPDRGGRKQQYLTPMGASVLASAGIS